LALSESRLVIATHNKGKVAEIGELLKPFAWDCVSAGELGLPEPEETGDTFAANAILKAEAAANASGLPALADDSGLCVNALNGAPGIYSARWAGPEKDFNLAMRKVEEKLGDAEDRGAYFVCVLALAAPGQKTEIFEGRVYGTLTFPPRGGNGFGYDPVFIPDGGKETFGEMEPNAKHAISHRARAFALFTAYMAGEQGLPAQVSG
jgi:XTP/dITP diphosphohydrolase